MGSRDKKRIRVRASKRRLNSSSRNSSLLAAHPSSNHHSHGRREFIDLGIGSSRSSTRRSERILNQSLAAERAAVVINDHDREDRDRPGPSRRSRERRRSRSRSHDEPDEDELIIAQQPEPENGIQTKLNVFIIIH